MKTIVAVLLGLVALASADAALVHYKATGTFNDLNTWNQPGYVVTGDTYTLEFDLNPDAVSRYYNSEYTAFTDAVSNVSFTLNPGSVGTCPGDTYSGTYDLHIYDDGGTVDLTLGIDPHMTTHFNASPPVERLGVSLVGHHSSLLQGVTPRVSQRLGDVVPMTRLSVFNKYTSFELDTAVTYFYADVSAITTKRPIAPPPAGGQLVNISTRAFVGTGQNILIGGAVIAGGQAQLLVRASGPALSTLGVAGVLAHPDLRVISNGKVIAENSGWSSSPNAAALVALFQKLGASPQWTDGSADAALLLNLDQGASTFQVSGADGGTGVALIEIYIVTDSGLPGHLVNLATRGMSGSGDNVMISGFVTEGDTQVLVRGIGPGIAGKGVSGVLKSPTLQVYDGQAVADVVTDWTSNYDAIAASGLFSKLGAFSLEQASADSVDVLDLKAGHGIRTIQLRSTDNGSGTALSEVYLVE